MSTDTTRRILLGRVHGAFGVRGEIKLESFTVPPSSILDYQPWTLSDARGQDSTLDGVRARVSPKGLVATFPGIEDREAAEALKGVEVYVERARLPPPAAGEYYWIDLEGLRVLNLDGVDFGQVSHLFSTGANDVLVTRGAERERMIPFVVPDYVVSVDFDARVVTVDWEADF